MYAYGTFISMNDPENILNDEEVHCNWCELRRTNIWWLKELSISFYCVSSKKIKVNFETTFHLTEFDDDWKERLIGMIGEQFLFPLLGIKGETMTDVLIEVPYTLSGIED